jgi:hypothetical protein
VNRPTARGTANRTTSDALITESRRLKVTGSIIVFSGTTSWRRIRRNWTSASARNDSAAPM